MNASDIEVLAERVLARHGARLPPVNVDEIANAEGLDYQLVTLEQLSGGYMRDGDGRAHAMIAASHHRLRQRFTKAHELAHHLLDEPRELRIAGYEHLRLPTGYRGRDRHWAHERFAAALLMPRDWIGSVVRDAIHRGLTWDQVTRRVAQTFEVSSAAAEVRLRELGHIEGGMR